MNLACGVVRRAMTQDGNRKTSALIIEYNDRPYSYSIEKLFIRMPLICGANNIDVIVDTCLKKDILCLN